MNDSLIKSDIFFFITTIGVIILTIGLSIIIYYGVKIFKNVSSLSEKAKEEGMKILDDVKFMRESTEAKSLSIASTLASFFWKKRSNRKKNKED